MQQWCMWKFIGMPLGATTSTSLIGAVFDDDAVQVFDDDAVAVFED